MDDITLQCADLTDVDFTGASLKNITWRDATCPDGTSANNIGADCCKALNTTNNPAVLAASCSALYAGVNLQGVIFANLDLSNADFSYASLEYAGFFGPSYKPLAAVGGSLGPSWGLCGSPRCYALRGGS